MFILISIIFYFFISISRLYCSAGLSATVFLIPSNPIHGMSSIHTLLLGSVFDSDLIVFLFLFSPFIFLIFRFFRYTLWPLL